MAAETKLLHQERVIRVAGVLMILSPFANFLFTVASLTQIANRWSPVQLTKIVHGTSTVQILLWIASIAVGSLMLKGRRASWLPVIMILGIFIVRNLAYMKVELREGWAQPVLSLITNVALFALVYLQEFRQSGAPQPAAAKPVTINAPTPLGKPALPIKKPAAKATAKPPAVARPAMASVPKVSPVAGPLPKPRVQPIVKTPQPRIGLPIDFEGHGTWANITEVTEREIRFRRNGEPPQDIERRTVEIVYAGHTLRLRFAAKTETEYVFTFSGASRDQLQGFAHYLQHLPPAVRTA